MKNPLDMKCPGSAPSAIGRQADWRVKRFYDGVWRERLDTGKGSCGDAQQQLAFVREFGSLRRTLKVLEIGCGIGELCNELYARGYRNVVGVDISEAAIAQGKKLFPHLSLYCMSASSLEFPRGHFDVCVSFDVIEHLPDIPRHLSEVRRVLKPQGRYLFQTPNIMWNVLFLMVSQTITRYLKGAGTSWKTGHPSLQSYWSLRRKLLVEGFAEVMFARIPPLSQRKVAKVPLPFRRILAAGATWKAVPICLFPNFWAVAHTGANAQAQSDGDQQIDLAGISRPAGGTSRSDYEG